MAPAGTRAGPRTAGVDATRSSTRTDPTASRGPNTLRPCASEIRRAVTLARAGESGAAREVLAAATRTCPADPVAHRELAALDLSDGWPGAAAISARTAVDLDGTDRHALEILAASYYLEGREVAALEVWIQRRTYFLPQTRP